MGLEKKNKTKKLIPENFWLLLKWHFDRIDYQYKLDSSKPLTQGNVSQKSGRTK